MSKRRAVGRPIRSARPIDKELIAVNLTLDTSLVTTTLKTTTFPCTIVGLRWTLTGSAATAAATLNHWAIVIVQDGEAANTPGTSNGGNFYQPEQNVLAFGAFYIEANNSSCGPCSHTFEGSTKTMRKLKQGDTMLLIGLCSVATGCVFDGVVQFFCKT